MLADKSKSVDKPEMDIAISADGALARISGHIDMDSSPALRNRLRELFATLRPKVMSIDLSGVTHIDSSGIATLIEALKVAASYEADIRLQGLEGGLLELFQSTGILSLFNGSTGKNSQSESKVV